MSEGSLAAGEYPGGDPAREDERTVFDTSVAHVVRVYDYWLGGRAISP
jgi:hypothetical protein